MAARKQSETTKDLLSEAAVLTEEYNARKVAARPGPTAAQVASANAEATAKLRADAATRGLSIRQPGTADPPPWRPGPKRLTITEVNGRVETIELDPERRAYLVVERDEPNPRSPWVMEPVVGRYGLFSLASVTLEDVDPDAA